MPPLPQTPLQVCPDDSTLALTPISNPSRAASREPSPPATALSRSTCWDPVHPGPSVGTWAPSPQVDINTPRLAGSVQPEAMKFPNRLGQSSVSRGFILTYTTGHKRAGSAGCTEKGPTWAKHSSPPHRRPGEPQARLIASGAKYVSRRRS